MSDAPSFPLHEAVINNKPLVVRGLIAEDPLLVLAKDLDGRTPLHWAVSGAHRDLVEMLLHPLEVSREGLLGAVSATPAPRKKIRIDLDDMEDSGGWTPVHIAALVGDVPILTQLLDAELASGDHADVNQATANGSTALHFAVSKGHVDVARLLLERGASARVKDGKGQYPLHRAASIGLVPLVQLLVESGKLNVNAKDRFGWTALHYALAEGHGDVAAELVNKYHADREVQNEEGHTPLDVVVDDKVKLWYLAHVQ